MSGNLRVDVLVVSPMEVWFLVLFAALTAAVIGIVLYERWKRHVVIRKTYGHQTLAETDFAVFSPPFISQLIQGKGAYSRHITAGLLYLVRKKVLVLKMDEDYETLYFSVEGAENEPSAKDEIFLYNWMMYEVGNEGVFYPDDLMHFTENSNRRETFLQKLYEWEQEMRQELANRNLIKIFPPFKRLLAGLSALMVLTGSGLIVFSPVISILFLFSGIVTFIVMFSYSSMTHDGLREFEKWKPFINKMMNGSAAGFEEDNMMTAGYVYAIALGFQDSYLSKFPIREASEVSIKTERFPLYFAAAPGATAVSIEGVKLIEDMEASLEQIVSPVAFQHNDDQADSGSSVFE